MVRIVRIVVTVVILIMDIFRSLSLLCILHWNCLIVLLS